MPYKSRNKKRKESRYASRGNPTLSVHKSGKSRGQTRRDKSRETETEKEEMKDIAARAEELMTQRDDLLKRLEQNATARQQLDAAYHQTCGAIAVLQEFGDPDSQVPTGNGEPTAAEVEVVSEL
tara:strand:+ start:1188 stop:1559 length:372 start_codon:yes stop_codon:yes gene_type:complete